MFKATKGLGMWKTDLRFTSGEKHARFTLTALGLWSWRIIQGHHAKGELGLQGTLIIITVNLIDRAEHEKSVVNNCSFLLRIGLIWTASCCNPKPSKPHYLPTNKVSLVLRPFPPRLQSREACDWCSDDLRLTLLGFLLIMSSLGPPR